MASNLFMLNADDIDVYDIHKANDRTKRTVRIELHLSTYLTLAHPDGDMQVTALNFAMTDHLALKLCEGILYTINNR